MMEGIQGQFRQGAGKGKGQGYSDCLTILQHHCDFVTHSVLQTGTWVHLVSRET